MRWRERGIRRSRDGSYAVRLEAGERELLAALPDQLRGAVETDDPSVRRLFPPAYDDPADDDDYRLLVRDGLLAGKLEALRVFGETVHHERLTEKELVAWLGALESLRLVLGTQLGVTEESIPTMRADDPEAPRLALYGWLSWLQEETVSALSETLPSGPRDDSASF